MCNVCVCVILYQQVNVMLLSLNIITSGVTMSLGVREKTSKIFRDFENTKK